MPFERLAALCEKKGLKMTEQRRIIAQVIAEAEDHPDVDAVYARANKIDDRISIATVYRTMKLLEEAGIVAKHDFGDGRARYEEKTDDHHDHLINIETGEVIEFHDDDLEELKDKIARDLGYEMIYHRLEIFARPLSNTKISSDSGSKN